MLADFSTYAQILDAYIILSKNVKHVKGVFHP